MLSILVRKCAYFATGILECVVCYVIYCIPVGHGLYIQSTGAFPCLLGLACETRPLRAFITRQWQTSRDERAQARPRISI